MSKTHLKFRFVAFCLFFGIITTGCDQIKAISKQFSTEEEPEVVQQTTSSAVQSSKNAPKVLPPNGLIRIGGWILTKEEFQERLDAVKEVVPEYDINDRESRGLILEELIRQHLIVMDAEKTGLAQQEDIKKAVDEFRKTLIVRESVRQLTENIQTTEEEAKEFYEEKKDILIRPIEVRVREIVLDSQLKANEILVEALKGIDFAQLAKEHSISESASNGGDIGFINEVPFPQMADALIPLNEGEISSVFKGPDGFYIVKVEEKKGGETIPFEEVKNDIMQNQSLLKQQQALIDHIEKLKKSADIEINEGLL